MDNWKNVWGSIPVDWGIPLGKFEDMTQKVWIRNNLQTDRIRIIFSNLYSINPMVLERVSIKTAPDQSNSISKPVTYNGHEAITVMPGQVLYSDPVNLNLDINDDFIISIYFKEPFIFYDTCQTWSTRTWHSSFYKGDMTGTAADNGLSSCECFPFFKQDIYECQIAAGISAIQALTEKSVVTVACFGDSITHMSYYFDQLADILYKKYPGKITLYNCGTGGNRLLYDACYVEDIPGHGKTFGPSGVSRFEKDVYQDTTPDIVFFLEGINDCTHGLAFGYENEVPTGKDLFQGLTDIMGKAHKHGSLFYTSTIMPFGCYEETFRPVAENIRQDYNSLIRENKEKFDKYIDLDQLVRNPAHTSYMIEKYHLGDGIHLNEEGGKIVARAIAENL